MKSRPIYKADNHIPIIQKRTRLDALRLPVRVGRVNLRSTIFLHQLHLYLQYTES